MRLLLMLGWAIEIVLLLGAAVLTVVRLVGIDTGPAIEIESFTPLAIPAYAVALAWLLLRVARRRRASRLRAAVRGERPPRSVSALVPVPLVVLVLAALVLHLVWWSPQVLGSAPAQLAGSTRMVVMNSNLYEGHADVADLVAQVTAQHVDLLVVEEVTTDDVHTMDDAGIADVLPYRIGHPDGTTDGTMVFADQPLTDTHRLATAHESWSVEMGDLRVLAVHPVAPVTPGQWKADHATILAAAQADHPDLVVGDFNATDDHQVMRTLAADGWEDAAQLVDAGWAPTWPANGLGPFAWLPRLVEIDHVLVGPAMTALSTHTVAIPDTDHAALVAVVAPRAPGA